MILSRREAIDGTELGQADGRSSLAAAIWLAGCQRRSSRPIAGLPASCSRRLIAAGGM